MSKLSYKKKAVTPPATLKLREKVFFIGFVLLFFGLPAFFLHRRSIHDQTASISKTVQKWKHIYHIDDEKAELIQQIEIDFHGNGSPFSIKPSRTRDEKHRHHEEISRLMSPEDGVHFMKAMEKSEGKH